DDIYFNFHATALPTPGDEFLKYQRFLIAHASYTHYNAANVFPVKLMDPAEEDRYYLDMASSAVPAMSSSRACCLTDWEPTITYRYGWNGGSQGNQTGFRWQYLLQFITRDLTGRYLWASHMNRFILEYAYPRADFAGGWRGHPVSDLNSLGFPSPITSANANKVTGGQSHDGQ